MGSNRIALYWKVCWLRSREKEFSIKRNIHFWISKLSHLVLFVFRIHSKSLHNINSWTIQLGITRRNSHTYYGQKVKVQRVLPHPQYNLDVMHDNDIALFQVCSWLLKIASKFRNSMLKSFYLFIHTLSWFTVGNTRCIPRKFTTHLFAATTFEENQTGDNVHGHRLGQERGQKT